MRTFKPGLLVGADGGESTVRTLAGIAQRVHDYRQTALVCTAVTERPHGDTALAEVVLDAKAARQDIGALRVLRRYERWRKGENLAMMWLLGWRVAPSESGTCARGSEICSAEPAMFTNSAFGSAGALEFVNEHSGFAVASAVGPRGLKYPHGAPETSGDGVPVKR